MTGKTVIVTGASSGLGYEVARYLCEGGNDVILACRNEEKTKRAIDKIKQKNPNAMATFMQLDLADSESIRKFVDDFHQTEKKLHVLINNAGCAPSFKDTKRQYTKDNFELTMGTNHLGPFLLTNLLLDDLKKVGSEENGEARIVIVSTSMHDPENMKRKNNIQPLDLENFFLFNENSYNGLQAYKNSKAANIMFMYELARRLEGSNVSVNAVNPGYVPSTDLMRSATGVQKFFARYVLHGMLRFAKLTRTVVQGATAIANLATDEKFKGVSGKYYQDGNEAQTSAETKEEEKQNKLWEMSGGYLKMEGFEPLDVPEPPPPEEEKKEENKEEAAKDGEVKPTENGEADNKAEGEEAEEKKTDEAETEEKKDDEKEKTDEKAEEKVEKKQKRNQKRQKKKPLPRTKQKRKRKSR